MRRWILGVATVCVASNVFAQSAPKPALTVRAYRVNQPMRIDGKLDEHFPLYRSDVTLGGVPSTGFGLHANAAVAYALECLKHSSNSICSRKMHWSHLG